MERGTGRDETTLILLRRAYRPELLVLVRKNPRLADGTSTTKRVGRAATGRKGEHQEDAVFLKLRIHLNLTLYSFVPYDFN